MLEEYLTSVKGWIGDHHKTIGLSVGGILVTWKLGGFLIEKVEEYKRQQILLQWENGPKDKVVLHTLPRGKTIPNLSPFAMKLETYLRITKIPYEVDFELPMGPLGKTPWITLNGEHIVDSQIIIDYLRDKYGVTLGKNYTEEQRAIAHSVRIMMDEYFYWGLCLWRYVYSEGKGLDKIFDMPPFAIKIFYKMVNQRITENSWGQGVGRHDKNKVIGMMKRVIKSAEDILGQKKYLLGDVPCEEDSALFGFIGMALWAAPGSPYEKFVEEECPNLVKYCERMKLEFWGDWDNCLAKSV